MTPRALFHPARLARRPVLSTQSDERLVDLVRAGSEPAFETIVERYRRALMRYVSRLLPPERAEDVVQQAFVKAYEAMHRDAAELNLRPWLYRIAHNTALNALRDRSLRHGELDERIDSVERPDQALERTEGLRDLLVAVQALPERQRDAILLRELEGRSYEEIALALGVTGGAVRQLLNRARNSLRSAAAAVTPMPLLTRLASGDSTEPAAARVAEMVGMGAAGGGALVFKLCATALVTGAIVSGVAVTPDGGRDDRRGAGVGAEPAEAAEGRSADSDSGDPVPAPSGRGSDRAGAQAERGGSDGEEHATVRDVDDSGPGGGDGDDANEGPGGGDDDAPDDDHSGPGGGGGEPELELEPELDDHSGPGGGGEAPEPLMEEAASIDNSGPGGGGGDDAPEPDNSGPGSAP
ncbi:MAG TPA: sigma-70 family RNA polymerase sigma factor [Thermoleophilaceae bacterium]|nr:sigma-70 family RNA polymerase sigma factor [Thermoleophilaceae bacterium]